MPETSPIVYDLDEAQQVVTITLNRPTKLNALTLQMLDLLEDAVAAAEQSDARVVVVRSASERAFSVGADIDMLASFSAEQMWREWTVRGHRAFDRLANVRPPTVAVLRGYTLGGGLELALACDFRIASDTAELGLPEVGIGTIPGWGGTARLVRTIGEPRALELILTRRRIDARQALALSLIHDHHKPEHLEGALQKLLGELRGGKPVAVQAAKQLVRAVSQPGPSAALEFLASGFTTGTADYRSELQSFTRGEQG